jgi:glycosyltransferase involved in cell wall biosynthesis
MFLNNMSPQISVLMSVHNGEAYLKDAIDSILAQTFTDFEFILINDCSTDTSKSIIESYNDERIVVINNEVNLGLTRSLNLGLAKAVGKYVARMDSDDTCSSDRLQKQYEHLEAHQGTLVVGSNINIMNDEGYIVKENEYPESFEDILGTVFFKNPLVHSTAMFRREEMLKIGGYNIDYKKSQDYELWLNVIQHNGILSNIPGALVNFRVHSKSITQDTSSTSEQENYAQAALQKALKKILNIEVSVETLRLFRYIYLHNNSKISLGEYNKLLEFVSKLNSGFKKYIESKSDIEKSRAYKSFESNLNIFKNNLGFGVVNTIFKLSMK